VCPRTERRMEGPDQHSLTSKTPGNLNTAKFAGRLTAV